MSFLLDLQQKLSTFFVSAGKKNLETHKKDTKILFSNKCHDSDFLTIKQTHKEILLFNKSKESIPKNITRGFLRSLSRDSVANSASY